VISEASHCGSLRRRTKTAACGGRFKALEEPMTGPTPMTDSIRNQGDRLGVFNIYIYININKYNIYIYNNTYIYIYYNYWGEGINEHNELPLAYIVAYNQLGMDKGKLDVGFWDSI